MDKQAEIGMPAKASAVRGARAKARVNADGIEVAGASGSGKMFDAIADRYDRLNRILSLGLDEGWRRRAVRAMNIRPVAPGAHVLDLATGTGDLAIAVAKSNPEIRVVGLDPSSGMLAEGRKKMTQLGLAGRVALELGDAQSLPFEDDHFDAVGIAFGIRNVVDRDSALREMARVTKPGGRVVVLELSEPSGLLGLGARLYLHQIVPRVGALLSGRREYRYLQKSIAAFPDPQRFAQQLEDNGLRMLDLIPLTFGVSHLYVGQPNVDQLDVGQPTGGGHD